MDRVFWAVPVAPRHGAGERATDGALGAVAARLHGRAPDGVLPRRARQDRALAVCGYIDVGPAD